MEPEPILFEIQPLLLWVKSNVKISGSLPFQTSRKSLSLLPLYSAAHYTPQPAFHAALTFDGSCKTHILALPDAQETTDDPCDIGSDPSTLHKIVADNKWPVDLSLIKDGWNIKTQESRYSPHDCAIKFRAREARIFLRQKVREMVRNGDTDAQIVLITHGGYLHYFTDDWEDASEYPGTGWHNCETRSYIFEEDLMQNMDEEARLTETMESRQKRGKMTPMLERKRQPELFELAMECWGTQGLQRPDRVELELEKNATA